MHPLVAHAQPWARSLAAVAAAVAAFYVCRGPSARLLWRVMAVAAGMRFADGSERHPGRARLSATIGRVVRFLVGATSAIGAAALAMGLAW